MARNLGGVQSYARMGQKALVDVEQPPDLAPEAKRIGYESEHLVLLVPYAEVHSQCEFLVQNTNLDND